MILTFRKFRMFGLTASLLLPFTFYLLPCAPCAQAHRYHTSLTRIDYNEKEKLIEITIQLFTHDLVPVLEKRSGKQLDLDNTPGVDKIILEYLSQNFVLKNKKGDAQILKWVGKEVEVDTAYIYVEISSTENLEGASLKNTIFFETFAEQTNLVTAHFGGKKADLLFVAGDKFKEFTAK